MIKLIGLFSCFFLIVSGQRYFTADLRYDSDDGMTDTSVIVDFGKEEKHFVDSWPYLTIRISSNETILYQNDIEFKSYKCRPETCEVIEEDIEIPDPQNDKNKLKAHRIKPKLSFGKNLWSLGSHALYVLGGEDPVEKKQPSLPYGYLGLGLGGDAFNNYQTEYPIFSISIDRQAQRGELIFGKDAGRYNEDKPPVILNSTSNWAVRISDGSIGNATKKLDETHIMIFDFSYTNIILPEVFKPMLDEFAKSQNMVAQGDQYIFEGNVSTLPPLKFHSANGSAISIPSSAYMKRSDRTEKETYYFGILHAGQKIILGHSVISQFYLVFEAKNLRYPTISIYELPDPNAQPKKKEEPIKPAILIAIGIVLLIIASSLAFWCGRKSQVKKLDEYLKLHSEKTGDQKSSFVV